MVVTTPWLSVWTDITIAVAPVMIPFAILTFNVNLQPHDEVDQILCRAPLHEECPKHYGHKEDPGVTPGTCGAIGERAQVILLWVRAPGVGNVSHPWRLGCTRLRP